MNNSKWTWVGVAVVAAVLALGSYEWLQEHDARIKAEATASAAQVQIDAEKKDAAQIQTTLSAKLAVLETARNTPATPQQIVISASKLIPNLPQPLNVVTPPPTQQVVNGKTEEVPSAPVVQVPTVDLKSFQDYAVTCEENSARLTACSLTQADLKTQLADTATQRDAYKTALKGGTFWQRFKHDAKVIGITSVITGVTVYALEKK